jgi:hypothetical protein
MDTKHKSTAPSLGASPNLVIPPDGRMERGATFAARPAKPYPNWPM